MAEELGTEHVSSVKAKTELRQIKKEINELKKKLQLLQLRKAELEKSQGLALSCLLLYGRPGLFSFKKIHRLLSIRDCEIKSRSIAGF